MARSTKATKAEGKPETPTSEEAPKAPKIVRERQNGQTKPAEGTKTRALWDIIDAISAKHGEPAPRRLVLERAEKEGFNPGMSANLYAHWRRFHGLVGKAAPGKAPAAPAAAAAAAGETADYAISLTLNYRINFTNDNPAA